ncbi:site-specific integrase [Bradyrhizobium barranii]
MLLLTGLRLNECAQLSWPELSGDLITIPALRMKAKDATAVEHLVPVTAAMQEIIGSLPRHRGGKYLFSLSEDVRPLSMSGLIKSDLDRRMLPTLRALARRRGEDHLAVELQAWTNTTCAARCALDCRHCASRTTSLKPFSRIVRAASSAPMTRTNISMNGARR